MILEKLYDKCLRKWGLKSQILMLAEECSELTIVCLHWLRARKQHNLENLAEEIADVEIMTEEIKYFFKIGDLVEHYKAVKLKRLKELLKDA